MLVMMEQTLLLRILLSFQSFQLSRFIAWLFDTSTFSYIYVIYVLEGEIFYLPHTKFRSGISEYYKYICIEFNKGVGREISWLV